MSQTPDFVRSVQRMQAQIDYLIDQGRDVTWESFNDYLLEVKRYWLEKESLSADLRMRVEALAPIKVGAKERKYAGLRRFAFFGHCRRSARKGRARQRTGTLAESISLDRVFV